MPYLFLGIQFSRNHFFHFFIFGKYKKNQSKNTQSQSIKKIKLFGRKVFFFLHFKENTFLFFIVSCPNCFSPLTNNLRRCISHLPGNFFSSNVFIYLMFSSFLFLICSYSNDINLVIYLLRFFPVFFRRI